MLSIKLTNCTTCANIPSLLFDIDCKLFNIAKDLYNNTKFALNKSIKQCDAIRLLHYKRILTYRICNKEYANRFTTGQIASKIKILKYK